MVKLTEYEHRMLNGEMGLFKQKALQKIVEYANVLGAEELCEVTKATLFFGAHPYLDVVDSVDYNEIFSKMFLCCDEVIEIDKFDNRCFSQTCAGPCDHYTWEPLNLTKEIFDKNREYLNITSKAGVSIAGSCTPFLNGWIPLQGEHFVTTESSNVIMANSVFGAYGNADGLEAAAWSAICGRTPKWGLHVKENRYGTHIFEIECKSETAMDWDVIGYTIGRLLPPHARPVISGNFQRPDIVKLKQCFGSLATTSGAEICHIVGITPEAPNLETALCGHKPEGTIIITQEEYDKSLEYLCADSNEDIQLVVLGCPHYSLEEIKKTADYLKGKKIQEDVSVWIWTDISTQAMADVSGYTKIINEAGAHLFNSACPLVVGRNCLDGVKALATDGAKQAHYIRSDIDAIVYYGTREQCLDAAINGKWGERNE
jgi:predicted aconitase